MELLEGQTLKHRIEGKPLKTDQLLDLAIQIADGLDAAHARGIIHRDIKPANTLRYATRASQDSRFRLGQIGYSALTGGGAGDSPDRRHAYCVDRCRAPHQSRHRDGHGGVHVTRAGEGEPLDARADLFSFGCVLYGMATGQLAFAGNITAAIFGAIFNEQPHPPCRANPELPAKLEEIILKALEKDRELRYQHAADIRADLKRLKRDTDSGSSAAPFPAPLSPAFALAGVLSSVLVGLAAIWLTRHTNLPRP